MSTIERPPIDPELFQHSPDDLDGLLHAYFRSEMPDPWPELHAPAPRSWPARRRVPSRDRFVLAASVAILLAGSTVFFGSFRERRVPADPSASDSFTAMRPAYGKPPTPEKQRPGAEKIPANNTPSP